MKRKFISVLFALVLVLSLGLVTAVPAAADPGTLNVVPFTLTQDGSGTAAWSDAEYHTGSYSVKLYAPASTGGYGKVVMPLDMEFENLADFSFYVEGGAIAAQALPLHDIKLEIDETATSVDLSTGNDNNSGGASVDLADKIVVLASQPGQSEGLSTTLMSDGDDGWEKYGTHSDATINVGTGEYWSIFVYSAGGVWESVYDYFTWDAIHTALDGHATVTEVRAELRYPQNPAAVDSTVYVDDITINGTTYYGLIQDAIDSATAGDTVSVAAGTYTEDITIDEEVTLQGAGKTTTTINRDTATSTVVLIQASNVKITGFKIDGKSSVPNIITSANDAIYDNIEITNCHIVNSINSAVLLANAPSPSGIATNYKINDNTIEYFGSHSGEGGIEIFKVLNVEVKRNTIKNANSHATRGTYAATGVYFFDYSGGTIADNVISNCFVGITVNSNVEETYVDNNTITECHRGILTAESFAKIHITNNSITTRRDPIDPVTSDLKYVNEQGILIGGDGDYYDSIDLHGDYAWEVDNLQHEVSGNTVTGTATTDSFGLGVMPGWFDEDYGASGTFTNNTVSGYKYGIKVWGTYAPYLTSTEDKTGNVNVSFNYNSIVGCTIGATTDTIWSGTVDAINNWWGNASGPADAVKLAATGYTAYGDSVSANVDYEPWLLAVVVTGVTPTTYDKTLALKNGWTLVSTDKEVAAGTAWIGTTVLAGTDTILAYKYTPGTGYPQVTMATLLTSVDAYYLKTSGGGGVGINYSTSAPGVVTKTLSAGWNIISCAGETDAYTLLSQLRYVQIGEQEGVGLTSLVGQGGYNQFTGNISRTLVINVEWLGFKTINTVELNPFDGYWVYMNAGKSFGVIPD